MRVYISGKISGLDKEVSQGYFEQVENQLHEAGHIPLNPWKILPFHPDHKWEDYMIEDIKVLFACDAVLMLDNWTDSKGAKIEHAIALQMGLEIYYPSMHQHLLKSA